MKAFIYVHGNIKKISNVRLFAYVFISVFYLKETHPAGLWTDIARCTNTHFKTGSHINTMLVFNSYLEAQLLTACNSSTLLWY